MPDKNGRVIHHGVLNAVRKVLLQLLHRSANLLGELERIGSRSLKDRQRNGCFVIQQRAQRVAASAEFDPRDVLEQRLLPIGAGFYDDLTEFVCRYQPALRVDLEFEIDWPTDRLLAN